jgi:hypothetical protein
MRPYTNVTYLMSSGAAGRRGWARSPPRARRVVESVGMAKPTPEHIQEALRELMRGLAPNGAANGGRTRRSARSPVSARQNVIPISPYIDPVLCSCHAR